MSFPFLRNSFSNFRDFRFQFLVILFYNIYIVMSLNESRSFQSMLTTHNTDLMNNKTTRPDCCYIMTSDKICSLSDATDRELREGHNLAKLYKSGEFNA